MCPVAVCFIAIISGDGSRAAATSKMEHFVIIVNGWKPLTITTKQSILDVAAALDQPLILIDVFSELYELVALFHANGRCTRYSNRFNDIYVTISGSYKDVCDKQ